jgi:hypothetical protein
VTVRSCRSVACHVDFRAFRLSPGRPPLRRIPSGPCGMTGAQRLLHLVPFDNLGYILRESRNARLRSTEKTRSASPPRNAEGSTAVARGKAMSAPQKANCGSMVPNSHPHAPVAAPPGVLAYPYRVHSLARTSGPPHEDESLHQHRKGQVRLCPGTHFQNTSRKPRVIFDQDANQPVIR